MSTTSLTSQEFRELANLRSEWELSSLGDRPQSIAAGKLKRFIELESRNQLHPRKTAFALTLDEYEELAGEFTNEKLQGDTHIADRLMLSAFIIWLRLKTKENSSGEK